MSVRRPEDVVTLQREVDNANYASRGTVTVFTDRVEGSLEYIYELERELEERRLKDYAAEYEYDYAVEVSFDAEGREPYILADL